MKWVMVFNGSRDGYQAPLALAERDRLAALVTDWYSPLDRPWVRSTLRLAPARVRAAARRRYRDGLASGLVDGGVFNLMRMLAFGSDHRRGDGWLGRRAGTLAARHGAGLLAYSYYAHAAFAAAPSTVPRLLFQVHPHPRSLASLYSEELQLVPEARESLLAEEELQADAGRLRELSAEPQLADGCIAASRFTASTLIEQGVAPDRIRVVPYGVDLERFRPLDAPPPRPFRVLFVGQMTQRKGLSYLLEAWRRAALPDSELVLAGRGIIDRGLLARAGPGISRRENVAEGELRRLYQTSHVFCMPSLAEGFGLVYLEALASGTPVIGTTSTGADDVVRDGVDGFVIERRDVAALVARLRWCHEQTEALGQMRRAARQRAEEFSWSSFRRALVDAVDELAQAGPSAHGQRAGPVSERAR